MWPITSQFYVDAVINTPPNPNVGYTISVSKAARIADGAMRYIMMWKKRSAIDYKHKHKSMTSRIEWQAHIGDGPVLNDTAQVSK